MWWFSKTGGENEQPVGGNAEGGNNLPDSRLASQPAASRVLPVGYDTTYMRPPARGTKGRITATDRSRYYLHQMLDSNQRFFDEDATASIEMQDYDDNDPNPQAPQQGHNRRGHDRDNDLLDRFLASEGDHFAHEQGGVLLTPHSYEDIVTSASCRSDTSGIVLTEKDDADAAKKGRKPPARDVSTKSMGGVSHPQGMKPRGGEGDAKPVFVDEKGDVSAAKKHGNVFSRLGNSREIAEQLGEDDEELARKIAENEGGARPSMRKGGYGFRTKTLMDLEKEVTSERYRATRGSSSMFADTGAGRMMEEALLGRSMQQGVFNALAHGGATRSAARPATPAELLVKKIYTTEQIDPEGPLGKCLTTGAAYMPTREERMDERFAWFRSRWASTNTVEMDPLLSWEDKLRIAFRNIQHWLDIYSDVVFTAVLVASWSLFLHVYDVGFIGIGPIEPNFFMETLKLPPALRSCSSFA
ncbi:unnamed protein product [Amoebophrya sp. A25]|nr:unnamed protein product [Amoebophrya sp. A25]|eukprot:GSA25T00010899001.1